MEPQRKRRSREEEKVFTDGGCLCLFVIRDHFADASVRRDRECEGIQAGGEKTIGSSEICIRGGVFAIGDQVVEILVSVVTLWP
jgi:hypothetical protein